MEKQQIIQLQMIEQEANQLEQQLKLVEQHIFDMQKLTEGLNELETSDKKEILANIGKGIYIPAEIKSKELIVEIGNKILVKKSIPETKNIIDEQLKRLIEFKQQIIEKIGEMQEEMNMMIKSEKTR